jgi:ribosomal-protein-alanine N-acetyltransferase
MEVTVRRATAAEAAVLGDVGFAAWADSAFANVDAGRVDRHKLLADFRSFGLTHASRTLVAARGPEILGWGAREGDDACISDLWVAPGHQGQGIGGRLLAALVDEVAAAGHAVATLETLASNSTAITFYQTHGFIVSWRREKFSSTLGYAIDKVGMNKSLTV